MLVFHYQTTLRNITLSLRFKTFLLSSIVITVLVISLPIIPLGVVSNDENGAEIVEWLWERHDTFTDVADLIDRLLWPLFAAACLICVGRRGIRVMAEGGRPERCFSYGLLLLAAVQWFIAVQQSAASPHKELKPLWVLYDPGASGYFFEAVFKMEDEYEFLQGYEERMSEGDVLHVGTHPPGMFLLAKGCISICENFPTVRSIVSSVTPSSTVNAFRFVEQNARLERPLSETELGGLKLLSLVMLLLAVLTIVPLALLSTRLFSPTTAWVICCLWPTVPAIPVFFPKSDLIFPSLSLMLLLSATVGCRSMGRAVTLGIPSGITLLLAATMSLAILPTVAAIGIFLLLIVISKPQKYAKPGIVLVLTVLCTLAGLVFIFDQLYQCNLVAVFKANLHNHAGFYEQFQRTWWKWLVVNPVELAFAVGLPLLTLAVLSVSRLRGHTSGDDNDHPEDIRDIAQTQSQAQPMLIGLAMTIVLLWLSGKNNGEAARLWCFMTPWVLVLSGPGLQRQLQARSLKPLQNAFSWLLISQLVICLITVSRVNGFSF